jgi:hypothetical protein
MSTPHHVDFSVSGSVVRDRPPLTGHRGVLARIDEACTLRVLAAADATRVVKNLRALCALQAGLAAAAIEEGPVFRPLNRHGRVSRSA